MVREKFLSRRAEPSQATRRRGGLLKRYAAASGVLGFVVPEFLLIADRAGAPATAPSRHFVNVVRTACPEVPAVTNPALSLSTYPWAPKSVVTVLDRGTGRPIWVVKASSGGEPPLEQVCREYENLQTVNRVVRTSPHVPFTVPAPMGQLTLNGRIHSVEQAVQGMSAARLVFWLRQAEVDNGTRAAFARLCDLRRRGFSHPPLERDAAVLSRPYVKNLMCRRRRP